jgi:cell shape-determining protein MreC
MSSNLKSLPDEVNKYTKLNHKKRALNRQVAEINAELRQLDQVLIEKMSEADLDA